MLHLLRRLPAALSLTPLLVLFAAACSDSPTAGGAAAVDVAPRFDIRDAARGDGTPGFYFLTPIAPLLAGYPGVFDAERDPVVEICAWSGAECVGAPVARFTMAEGTAGSRVVLEGTSSAYRVDWNTTAIPVGQLHRIRVLDGVSELGHADVKRPAAGETPATLKAQGVVPLGNASLFPIRFRVERNTPPTVAITAPADHSIVPAGAQLTLAGTAHDAEEGDLSDRIVWRSDRSATPLGAGASLTVALTSGRHAITASVTDAMGRTTTTGISVVASIISAPAALNVPFGGSASIPITLSEPAPDGGLTLAVTSTAPGTASLALGSVTIPAGSKSANATIHGVAPGAATVMIANPDYGMASTNVTVTAQLNVVQTSVSFAQGRTADVTVELLSGGQSVAAPAGGLLVEFTSANPGCAIASPITIPAGLVSATASIAHGGAASTPCNTVLTASTPDVAGVATDDVTAHVGAAPSLALGSTQVGSSLQTGVNVTLGAPAPAGGLAIQLTSSDPGVLRLSSAAATPGTASTTINVAAGQTSGTVQLHGVVGATGSATVTATAAGYTTATAVQNVHRSAIELVGVPANTTSFSANTPFYTRVGVLNSAGTAIGSYQNRQAGAGPLVVTITNSDASVGQLVRTGETGQSVTVRIAEGSNSSPSTVAAGGVAFDPMGAGSTVVTASAAGFASLGASTQGVNVSAPSITHSATRVGAGLQTSINVTMGAAAPADLPLTFTSANPGVLLVSPAADVAGAGTQVITLPAGQSSRTIYLQGVHGTADTVRLHVSAPGYTAASVVHTVAPSAVELTSVPTTTTTLSASTAFYARVGVLNSAGTAVNAYQAVAAGTGARTVAITNSDASVAQLVRTGETAQSVTVSIAEGSNSSPTTVAAGGVAFAPLGAGSTVVTASLPGFVSLAGSSRTVVVSAPSISVGTGRVGAGLQTSITVSLGVAAPAGGTRVSLASSDPALLRISNTAGTAGTASTTLDIAAGQSSGTLQIHGVPGAVGTATVTATAAAYATGSGVQTVARSALAIVSLPASTTTLSPNTAFQVRTGVLNSAGTAINSYQNIQAGAGALDVSVTNGSPSVAQLVRTSETGQGVTVRIVEGSDSSPSTVAAGGVAFDPLGGGSTVVTASAPGMPSMATDAQTVTVNAPGMSVSSARVGGGLEGSVTVTLGAPAPSGGLSVAVVSSAPDVLLLGAAAGAVGVPSVTLTVPAGQSSATVHLQGVAGRTGTATVTASAPGYTNGTATQVVGVTALEITSLPASTNATSANSAFYVRVGVLNDAGTSFVSYQNVRAGTGPLVVQLANSDAAVGRLVRTGFEGQSTTVQIAEGDSSSPNTVAGGGVAFSPLAAGSTTVTATTTGGVRAASQVVTVK